MVPVFVNCLILAAQIVLVVLTQRPAALLILWVAFAVPLLRLPSGVHCEWVRKQRRLFPLFLLLALVPLFAHQEGRQVLHLGLCIVYSDGVREAIQLLLRLTLFTTCSVQFTHRFGRGIALRSAVAFLSPLRLLGINAREAADILFRAYTLFPEALVIVRKGLRTGWEGFTHKLQQLAEKAPRAAAGDSGSACPPEIWVSEGVYLMLQIVIVAFGAGS